MLLASMIFFGLASASEPPSPAHPSSILVHVRDGIREVSGARVFILGDDGRVVEEALTGEDGDATLKPVDNSAKPVFLLAEHNSYSISGQRWRVGAFEYCIDFVLIHSCDYTLINPK